MSTEFDPKTCPVGISNEKSIENVGDKLDMAIQRLEEKMDDMKEDLSTRMTTGFTDVNGKLDKLDSEVTNFKNSLDDRIETKVKQLQGAFSAKIIGWVVAGLGGAVAIAVVTSLVLKALHLN